MLLGLLRSTESGAQGHLGEAGVSWGIYAPTTVGRWIEDRHGERSFLTLPTGHSPVGSGSQREPSGEAIQVLAVRSQPGRR